MDNMTFTEDNAPLLHSTRIPLYTGGVAAILSSICCIGSFLFLTIGLSGSTSLYLITLAEWSRIPLLVVALVALFCLPTSGILSPLTSTVKLVQILKSR